MSFASGEHGASSADDSPRYQLSHRFDQVGTAFPNRFEKWLKTQETLATSTIAWAELLNGPITPEQIKNITYLIEGRVLPFGAPQAAKAAELFNLAGRKRGIQPDCFIAATAICAKASLATENEHDFLPFVPAGLQLL